jgi:hypothetical protein
VFLDIKTDSYSFGLYGNNIPDNPTRSKLKENIKNLKDKDVFPFILNYFNH